MIKLDSKGKAQQLHRTIHDEHHRTADFDFLDNRLLDTPYSQAGKE